MTRNWWAERLGAPAPPYTPPPTPLPPTPLPQGHRPERPEKPVETCPECGSGNYMAAANSKYLRCFDCGYPVQQSGSGVGSVKSDAPAKKAKQVGGAGFQPGTIVGRVGE